MSDIDYRPDRKKPYIARWREPDGRQRSRSFALKKEARAYLTAIQGKLDARTYIPPEAGKLTLREYSTGWLAASTADISTRDASEIRWRVHILPVLGDHPLAAIRTSTVQSFAAGLQRRQAAPNYIKVILGTLSAAFTAAVADRLIPFNPCTGVKSPRVPQTRVVPWEAARVSAVRASLPAHYAATVDCGAGLGLRQGEAFGLAVEDIDFLRRAVHVRRQVRLLRGSILVFGPPKGSKERDVPLPESVALALAVHIREVGTIPITLPWTEPGGKPVTANLIFTSGRGLAVNKNSFNHAWRDALDAAGVPRERVNGFHGLRHTYASVLLSGGVDVRALSEYLGHHDPGFTLNVYAHVMPSAPDKARAAIDSALGSAPDVRQGTG
jgi:integrase